jgi:hypothetical protein
VIEGIPGVPRIVAAFSVRRGRIAAIDMNGDPAKTMPNPQSGTTMTLPRAFPSSK